jgi:hypothetical protein
LRLLWRIEARSAASGNTARFPYDWAKDSLSDASIVSDMESK